MHPLLSKLCLNFQPQGSLLEDVQQFLTLNRCPRTAEHSLRVAQLAAHLAGHFDHPAEPAAQAGLLHDISAVFPWLDRAHIAHQLGLEVLPEEDEFPPIIHQKLSALIAGQIFGITDPEVLSAIACHTTLRPGASRLDKIVFVADKIEWDGSGRPPYLDELLAGLQISLDHAALAYLDHLLAQRQTLPVIHPWLLQAHAELSQALSQPAGGEA
jgi:predicted HD superfamily hydrolase involved in NAD metabolism